MRGERNRERRPEKLSERLRRTTESKWHEDPYLGTAGDLGGYWDDGEEDQQ